MLETSEKYFCEGMDNFYKLQIFPESSQYPIDHVPDGIEYPVAQLTEIIV